VSCVDVQWRRRRLYGDERTHVDAQRPTLPCVHVCASMYGAVRSVNGALHCRQSRRVVSDVGIGLSVVSLLDI